MTFLLMGSAEALPQEPASKPVFMEDMSEQQLASAVSNVHAHFSPSFAQNGSTFISLPESVFISLPLFLNFLVDVLSFAERHTPVCSSW